MTPPAVPVVVALGSNLGDRRAHLQWAADRLAALLDAFRLSSIIETDPEGVPDLQPPYLNAVAAGTTRLGARDLLERLLALEQQRQRTRTSYRGARTLDLDLILYGLHVIREPGLEVPHPRFRERRFVLEPLAGLAPAIVDPVTGLTAAGLLDRLGPAPAAE